MSKKVMVIGKPAIDLKKKLKKSFLKQNEGKWVVVLGDKSVDTDDSLEKLFSKHKKKIIESFRIPSKDMVMLL